MTQVFNKLEFHLILPIQYPIAQSVVLISMVTSIKNYKEIKIVSFHADNFNEIIFQVGKVPLMKILDKFYLFDFGEENQVLHQSFFDFIAPYYESLINKNLNTGLIQRYFECINEIFHYKDNLNVLDLGSGSGISFSVKNFAPSISEITLYGYEISTKMEKLSMQAGLKMLNQKSLPKTKDYFFDAIFGSYSFHFFSDNELYKIIWQKLNFGGIILANFHKGIGLENAVLFFKSVGAEIQALEKHANSDLYLFKKKTKPFISIPEAINLIGRTDCQNLKIDILLDYFLSYSIIPSYSLEQTNVILENDLLRLKPFFNNLTNAHWDYGSKELYVQDFCVETNGIKIEFTSSSKSILNDFNPAFLIELLISDDGAGDDTPPLNITFGNSLTITIRSAKLKNQFINSTKEITAIESARAPYFANSASYMGSKKALRQFLFSAIKCTVPKSFVSLDLMCGAGSVASILSMRYQTYVSDAMQFSKVLAVVQGSGFTTMKAQHILKKLRPYIKENFFKLGDFFQIAVQREDNFFHQKIDLQTKIAYQVFCLEYSYANDFYKSRYSKNQKIESEIPQYELFSLAYSNTFFGIKQAMQIDSLRYAIETLTNESEKTWALGALIATVSAVANTYAGHFAQPKYKDITSLSENEFIRLIEQRSLSIISEFEVRLTAFAHESDSNDLSVIGSIDGPWPAALDNFVNRFTEADKFVYVDAPYTRDEYSRYYHVLETLIDYKYYNLTGLGKIPEKKSGSRFKSNFFTRNENQLKNEFLNLFSTVLNNNAVCGWSYSNSATADCLEIIYETVLRTGCNVQSFEIPYEYKGQGGRGAKRIKEYYVVFTPIQHKPQAVDPISQKPKLY